MTERVALSKRTRFEVFKRDLFTCQYCGATPPKVILHVDHVSPVAGGGTNDMDNLITSCDACNLGKGAVPLSSVPMALKDKAAIVAEREEQLAGYQEILAKRRDREEQETWEIAEQWMGRFSKDSINKGYFQSVKNFNRKLGFHETFEAMEIALAKKPWSQNQSFRYFCGICWSKIKEQGSIE